MKLSDDSHASVERFFREYLNEPGLVLPPMSFHGGAPARLLMAAARGMDAITFGRRVFVRPGVFVRDGAGRATLPGRLVVHEARHVLQYEARGYPRFFRDYLLGYWKALRAGGRWDRRARAAAYMAIEEEREAYAAEAEYASRPGGGERFTLA
jgi:hypothetical protein